MRFLIIGLILTSGYLLQAPVAVSADAVLVKRFDEAMTQGDREAAAKLLKGNPALANAFVSRPIKGGRLPVILAAIQGGHLEIVRLLLDHGVNLAGAKGQGRAAFYTALGQGHTDIVELLINRGVNPRVPNESGEGALHVAAARGNTEIIALLLKHGLDVNAGNMLGSNPPITQAADRRTVEVLIAAGADIRRRNRGGLAPLHFAALRGNVEVAETLMAHGVKVDETARNGRTALHMAAKYGQTAVCKYLLDHGAAIDAKSARGETPLACAIAEATHRERDMGDRRIRPVIEFLLNRGAECSLHDLVWLGDAKRVGALLDDNPQLANAVNRRKEPILCDAAREGHAEVVRVLIEKGGRLDARDRNKGPLLHQAAWAGSTGVVQVLVTKGVHVNQLGPYGESALHWALARRNADAAKLLISKGSDIRVATKAQRADMNAIADDIDLIKQELSFLEASKKPVQIMAPVRMAFAVGDTPLHCVMQPGPRYRFGGGGSDRTLDRAKLARALVEKGADVNAANARGQRPLHYAVALLREKSVVEELIRLGADPVAKTENGDTAIELARKAGATEVAECLVRFK